MNKEKEVTFLVIKIFFWEMLSMGAVEFLFMFLFWDMSLSSSMHVFLNYGVPAIIVLVPVILAKKETKALFIVIGSVVFVLRIYALGIILKIFS